jgi:hypothetical protein
MTKEDLINAMIILINQKNKSSVTAEFIWNLWMNHGDYEVSGTRIINMKTGADFIADFPPSA